MSVVNMKFVNIIGPIEKFEELVLYNLIDCDIHLENALKVMHSIKGLYPFVEDNVFDPVLKKYETLKEEFNDCECDINSSELLKNIKSKNVVEKYEKYYQITTEKIKDIKKEIKDLDKKIDNELKIKSQIEHILDLDIKLKYLFNLDFVKFRFGRLSRENYAKLKFYIANVEAIVIEIQEDKDDIWLSYFTPNVYSEKIDSIFSSLFFERIRLSGKFDSTPKEALDEIKEIIITYKAKKEELQRKLTEFIEESKQKFAKYYNQVKFMFNTTEVKKNAAHTLESFYIAGWVSESDLQKLEEKLKKDIKLTYIVEDVNMVKKAKPPTVLKNHKLIKPFESLIRMYGLPSFNEIDPTTFVAFTYILMFGIMFGDVGQGAVLALIGIYLLKVKKMEFGGILTPVGIISIVFGFVYGSIFGNEEIIKPLIISPMNDIMTMLYLAVGFGVVMIFISMIFNIINGVKQRNITKIFFDKNGLAGFLFYLILVGSILYYVSKGELFVSESIVLVALAIPLIGILFHEPLTNFIKRKKKIMPDDKGGYFIEGFFELFETLLGILSNTISFVRVSAFALNHVGLSIAIWTLYEMASGIGGVFVVIIGNILIIALEGLIVGIQGLRLQYYEMFSRFFTGEGKEFEPLKINK